MAVAVFVPLAGLTILDAVRRPVRTRVYIALLFAGMALSLLSPFRERLPGDIDHLVHIAGALGIYAAPLILLVLAGRYRPVSRWLRIAGAVGLVGLSAASILHAEENSFVTASAYVYYGMIGTAAGATLARGAFAATGVTQWRLRFAAAGTAGVVLTIAVVLGLVLLGAPVGYFDIVYILGAAAGVAFFLAFAPPRWVRRGWQLTEFRKFLEATMDPDPTERERRALALVPRIAEGLLPGTTALVGLLAKDALVLSGAKPVRLDPRAGVLGRALQAKRALVVRDLAAAPRDEADLAAAYEATSVMVVPLLDRNCAYGALLVLLRSTPVFEDDDLELLELVAAETGRAVGQARLVAELADAAARTERLSDVGIMVASVAHETNNAITYMRGFVELALLDVRAAAPARGAPLNIEALTLSLEQLEKGMDRLARLTTSLKTVARRDDGRKEPIAVNDVLHNVEELVRLRARSDVDLRFVPAAPGIRVRGNAGELQQVLLNLTKNAIEALEGRRGRVEVRATRTPDGVELAVEDDGPGIEPELQARLFDAPVTTKAQGTGLGLTIARRIVRDHGGELALSSELGKGTTFRILLPASASA